LTDPSRLSNEQLMAIAGPPASARQSSPRSNQPRGIRNNNPGNIEDGSFARSLPGYAGSDGRFAIFNSPDAGTAAKSRLLGSYIERGFNTPASIINRWAPPSDNNPTSQYADYVARRAGVGVNDRVGPDQIPLIAQAISEFENGNTVDVGGNTAQFASLPQDATSLSNEDLMAIAGGDVSSVQPNDVVISNAVVNRNGRAVLVGNGQEQDLGPYDRWEADQDRASRENEVLAERRALPGYEEEYQQALGRSGNVPALISNLFQGQSLGALPLLEGALGYIDPNVEGIDRGLAGQAARDASRDRLSQLMRDDPLGSFGAQLAGGLLTPGLQGTGNYIAGAQGAARGVRAAQVGAGYGAAAGAIGGQGNALERLDDVAVNALVGAGAGRIGQGAVDRLSRAGVRAPSNARLLSREGVSLTPGQMLSEVPVVGSIARNLEEGASSIPFIGQPIAGARQQSVETFNRAAINRALAPLGERLPRNSQPGYASVDEAQGIVGRAYDRVLNGTEFRPDRAFYDDLGRTINQTLSDAGVPQTETLTRQINDRVFRVLEAFDDPITGQQFKSLESEFGNLAAQNLEATDGASRALGRSYQAVQEALRDGLRRQNPQAADDLRSANSAYARLMRVERAAGSTAAQANDGVFSPTQLGQAVGQMGSRRASARGDALMQDLAVAGRNIIPSRVGDSGTATRGAVTGLVAGAASGVPVAGAVAVPVIATSIAYSRPAQAALNAIYRATDSQTAREGVQELARLAQRNPALIPYYEGAVQFALSLGRPDVQAAQPMQPATQRPIPVQ